jgi:hypothetical protein
VTEPKPTEAHNTSGAHARVPGRIAQLSFRDAAGWHTVGELARDELPASLRRQEHLGTWPDPLEITVDTRRPFPPGSGLLDHLVEDGDGYSLGIRVERGDVRMAPGVGEVAGKARKRRRAWRRVHGDAALVMTGRPL